MSKPVNCGTRYGTKFWINLEPCGLICGSITWFLLFFGMYATSKFVIYPWFGFSFLGIVHLILFNGVSLMALYSHIKAMTTDPGAVPKDAKPLPNDPEENDYEASESRSGDRFKKFCRRCKAFKPARAHHCSICGRCIVKMDHHCPWVNNCVGIGNHKLFLLFVFWVFCACTYSLVLVSLRYIFCSLDDQECGNYFEHLTVAFLVLESVLFGLFTLCMMGDQYTVISTNQTQIDRLKDEKHEVQIDINEVFGTPISKWFHWSWVYPAAVHFADTKLRECIFGYRTESVEELSPLIGTPSETKQSHGLKSKLQKEKKRLRKSHIRDENNEDCYDDPSSSEESCYSNDDEIIEWVTDHPLEGENSRLELRNLSSSKINEESLGDSSKDKKDTDPSPAIEPVSAGNANANSNIRKRSSVV